MASDAIAQGAAAASAPVSTMSGMMMPMQSPLSLLQQRLWELGWALSRAFREMLADAALAPGRWREIALFLTGTPEPLSAVWLLASFGLPLASAAGAAWVVRRCLLRPRLRLGRAQPATTGSLLAAKLEEVAVDLAPAAVFLVVAQTLTHLLLGPTHLLAGLPSGTEEFGTVATGIISIIATGWVAYILVVLPLSAKRPGLRIIPMSDAEALWRQRTLGRIILVAISGWTLAFGFFSIHFGLGLAQLTALLDGLVVAALCLVALGQVRHSVTGFARYWHKLAVVSVFGLAITWARGLLLAGEPPLGRVLGTVLILLAIPAIDGLAIAGLRRLAGRMASRVQRRRTIFVPAEDSDQLTEVERPADPGKADAELLAVIARFTGVLHDAIAWCVLFAAAVALSRAWGLQLREILGVAEGRTPVGTAIDVAVTMLVGWYIWRLFEAGLAILLARDDGAPQSRSKTVEPLLRSVGVVVIGLGAIMVVLADVGVSIAPLLASAGVVGIAVGFGAQTIVKDLFSGTCFLIEDVFRIGEYIEAASAKGTVEKITFRTVALRHQNGPLHFVPYGSLGTVRNNSRDWVIDKFQLPLPLDTDSEQIRRLVKRIGQEMREDPALAPLIMAPLKAKLYRIDPGVKVFRCKVQTQPGLQFEVRTDAYRRIESALKEAGIPFATNSQTLTLQNALPELSLAKVRGLAPAAE